MCHKIDGKEESKRFINQLQDHLSALQTVRNVKLPINSVKFFINQNRHIVVISDLKAYLNIGKTYWGKNPRDIFTGLSKNNLNYFFFAF